MSTKLDLINQIYIKEKINTNYKEKISMENNIYVFLDKTKEGVLYFSGAVHTEQQAKKIAKDCAEANLKIDYTEVRIQEEEEGKIIEGLFLLLDSRYCDGKFNPTGIVLQNEDDAKQFEKEAMLEMPRKYVEIELMQPHKALNTILQNS